ncbi:MAG: prepilin-type N-terminal cleavage/methylation domain-containing protein [Candidatus Rifleibacteriota bacterium]
MKLNRKLGFTLMEIMVVIIVIAVLASVAGPMIGSITDQGRASATKSKISSIKSAIMAYKSDVGRYPFFGEACNAKEGGAYNQASVKLMGNNEQASIFVNENIGVSGNVCDFQIPNYRRKWKGPYFESGPDDFMFDAWGTKMKYAALSKSVYLWAAGPDMSFESLGNAINQAMVEAQGMDDITQVVFQARRDFTTGSAVTP